MISGLDEYHIHLSTYMLLLHKATIYLHFERLQLILQMNVTLLRSLTLISKPSLQLNSLVFQLSKAILVFAVTRANFVLQVPQLKIHLGSGLQGDSTAVST